jgi:hypothetical protein
LESGGDIIYCYPDDAHRGKAGAVDRAMGGIVKLFTDRELHLLKKALAMATLATELRLRLFKSTSDQADMKALPDEITESDVDLAYYVRAARIAVTGKPDGPRRTLRSANS